ncbi:MAG: hypothetical protein ABJG86_11065 [Nitratireductor sp.]
MIVSLILGILRVRWEWLIVVCALGTFLDWYRVTAANDWGRKIGGDLVSSNIIEIGLLVIALNVAAYFAGRGIRLVYDRLKAPAPPKT